jgi:hypothetical protein
LYIQQAKNVSLTSKTTIMRKSMFLVPLVMFIFLSKNAQSQNEKLDFLAFSTVENFHLPYSPGSLKDTTYSREHYLQKSSNQRTTAWVMLGAGIALTTVGIIGAASTFDVLDDNSTTDTYGVVALVGVGLALGSIPLFISSKHNAQKAATLSFRNQQILLPWQNPMAGKTQPALRLQIPL